MGLFVQKVERLGFRRKSLMAEEKETMDALVLTKAGHPTDNFKMAKLPKPKAGPGEVLVKVAVTAINPVDWKQASFGFMIPSFPAVLGCDLAGTVVALGAGVTSLKIGDRVCGFPGLVKGTFAAFCPMRADLCLRIPEGMAFNQAATFGVGALTAALALFHHDKLSVPSEKANTGEFVLIWGGASGVGTFCVELAALAGYKPIAVASKKNHDMLKKRGAAFCLDYHDGEEAVLKAVSEIVGEAELRVAVDIANKVTANTCAKALSHVKAARLATVAGAPDEVVLARLSVLTLLQLPDTVHTEATFLGGVPANAELTKVTTALVKEVQALLDRAKLHPLAVQEVEGGLGTGVVKALTLSSQHKVSACKLVVPL